MSKTTKQQSQDSPFRVDRVNDLLNGFNETLATNGKLPKRPDLVRKLGASFVGGDPKEYLDDLFDSIEGSLGKFWAGGENTVKWSFRCEEMIPRRNRTLALSDHQQFSTPLTIARLMTKLANIQIGDEVLEPCAGTGNLVRMLPQGTKFNMCEISTRRALVLAQTFQGNFDTLRVGDYLTARKFKPTVVISNPPWGSYQTGKYGKAVVLPGTKLKPGDVGERFLAKHLREVKPGGRVVCLLSRSYQGHDEFKSWLQTNYRVLAEIEMGGDLYKRRGTNQGSVLVVVDNLPPKGKTMYATMANQQHFQDMEGVDFPREALALEGTGLKPCKVQDAKLTSGQIVEVVGDLFLKHIKPGKWRIRVNTNIGGRKSYSFLKPRGKKVHATHRIKDVDLWVGGSKSDSNRIDLIETASTPKAKPNKKAAASPKGKATADSEAHNNATTNSKGLTEKDKAKIEADRKESMKLASDSPIFQPFARDYEHTAGVPHPRLVTESRNLAAIADPKINYIPHQLIRDLNSNEKISDEQFISIAAARQANLNGHGFLLADATGVGKSNSLVGFVIDSILEAGSKRVMVITKNGNNVSDLINTFGQVLGQPGTKELTIAGKTVHIVNINEFTNSTNSKKEEEFQPLPAYDEPTIYITNADSSPQRFSNAIAELEVDLLVADEAHNFKNCDTNQVKRATLWVSIHQDVWRNGGGFLYLTATPATSVKELEYLYGLNEWSVGTFEVWMQRITGHITEKKAAEITENILSEQAEQLAGEKTVIQKSDGGFQEKENPFRALFTPAEQEQIMRELKAKGKFMARDLWREMDFNAVEVPMDENQVEEFNLAIQFLRDVRTTSARYREYDQVGRPRDPGSMLQNAVKRLLGWYRLQKSVPIAKEALAKGEQVVISGIYLSAQGTEFDDDGHVGGFVGGAINCINFRQRFTKDGEEFTNEIPEAAIEIAELRERLETDFPAIPHAVEYLEEQFGSDQMIAITGEVSAKKRELAISRFQKGEVPVAFITGAGKTGISLHDVNGCRRNMIVTDFEWSAPQFLQEIGRVDRTGQVSNPVITVIHQGSAAEKKFLSTIASRLSSLGATSKGQAESTNTDALDDFEFSTDVDIRAMRLVWEVVLDDDTKGMFMHRKCRDSNFPDEPSKNCRFGLDVFFREMQLLPFEVGNRIMEDFMDQRNRLINCGDDESILASRTQATDVNVVSFENLVPGKPGLDFCEFTFQEEDPKRWVQFDQLPIKIRQAMVIAGRPKGHPITYWHKEWAADFNAKNYSRLETLVVEFDNAKHEHKRNEEFAKGSNSTEYWSKRAAESKIKFDALKKSIDTDKELCEFQYIQKLSPEKVTLERAIVIGMVTDHMHMVRKGLGSDQYGFVRKYRRVKLESGVEHVGLEIEGKGKISKVRAEFGLEKVIPKADMVRDLIVHDKEAIKLLNGWTLKENTIGYVKVLGAKMKNRDELIKSGAKYEGVGNYFYVPPQNLNCFAAQFGIEGLAE